MHEDKFFDRIFIKLENNWPSSYEDGKAFRASKVFKEYEETIGFIENGQGLSNNVADYRGFFGITIRTRGINIHK